ncbi:hypothetical protein DPMN_064248 [Dreissena polymorpha]|uniref:Uncharacterized protein n=1 Tax=Dreissena polymorpha TaxID=45954 RepID=A0A9D4CCV0_DREPO|nr:hypothetical protein DPMN_064248 [Dreissena polymorpha]
MLTERVTVVRIRRSHEEDSISARTISTQILDKGNRGPDHSWDSDSRPQLGSKTAVYSGTSHCLPQRRAQQSTQTTAQTTTIDHRQPPQPGPNISLHILGNGKIPR